MMEAMSSCVVAQVLFVLVKAFKKDNHLPRISSQVSLKPQWTVLNSGGKGIMDYVVVVQLEVDKTMREAIMIEVKNECATDGLPQCLLALKRIFETNQDRQPFYG